MTNKNSVLLMVKQEAGIDYNSLLNKIIGNYSNVNSARAALSRTLKDLKAFGLIAEKNKSFFITDKGFIEINVEMKNKLLLKLNEIVLQQSPEQRIDSIVRELSTLIARAKEDQDLLKAAKAGSAFYVADLKSISKRLKKRITQLNYLKQVLEKQINSLKELDFNERIALEWNDKTIKEILGLQRHLKEKEFFVKGQPKELLDLLNKKFEGKKESGLVFFNAKKLKPVLEEFERHLKNYNLFSLSFSDVTIEVKGSTAIIKGPYSRLKPLY